MRGRTSDLVLREENTEHGPHPRRLYCSIGSWRRGSRSAKLADATAPRLVERARAAIQQADEIAALFEIRGALLEERSDAAHVESAVPLVQYRGAPFFSSSTGARWAELYLLRPDVVLERP